MGEGSTASNTEEAESCPGPAPAGSTETNPCWLARGPPQGLLQCQTHRHKNLCFEWRRNESTQPASLGTRRRSKCCPQAHWTSQELRKEPPGQGCQSTASPPCPALLTSPASELVLRGPGQRCWADNSEETLAWLHPDAPDLSLQGAGQRNQPGDYHFPHHTGWSAGGSDCQVCRFPWHLSAQRRSQFKKQFSKEALSSKSQEDA